MHAITHPVVVVVDRVECIRGFQILECLACIVVFIVVGEHAQIADGLARPGAREERLSVRLRCGDRTPARGKTWLQELHDGDRVRHAL